MAFTEDFTQFFNTNDFATTANFTSPALGNINGIWDAETVQIAVGEAGIHRPQPVFTCASASIPNVGEGSLLKYQSVNYAVKDRLDDGTGQSTLMLDLV